MNIMRERECVCVSPAFSHVMWISTSGRWTIVPRSIGIMGLWPSLMGNDIVARVGVRETLFTFMQGNLGEPCVCVCVLSSVCWCMQVILWHYSCIQEACTHCVSCCIYWKKYFSVSNLRSGFHGPGSLFHCIWCLFMEYCCQSSWPWHSPKICFIALSRF